MVNRMAKKKMKICWKRLLVKALEDAIKKTIEIVILALVLGVTIKMIMIVVPAVSLGSIIAKLIKIKIAE